MTYVEPTREVFAFEQENKYTDEMEFVIGVKHNAMQCSTMAFSREEFIALRDAMTAALEVR